MSITLFGSATKKLQLLYLHFKILKIVNFRKVNKTRAITFLPSKNHNFFTLQEKVHFSKEFEEFKLEISVKRDNGRLPNATT